VRQGPDLIRELSRSYLFEGLSAEVLEPLAAVVTSRSMVRGEHLWHPGDPANELYVVASGETKSYLSGPNGEELVHLLHGPGMTFGEPGYFSVERTRAVANVATAPAVVIRLDRRELDPFMHRNTSTLDRALEGLAGIARWYGNRVMALELQPLRDRILLWLLDLVESPESGDGQATTAAVSQTTLAAMTGVSRENVNRALAGLMAEGTLRREGNRYVLVDEPRLRAEVARDWPVVWSRDKRRAD
jgi:CRP/FNR family transcriptional regulator, cyclic AMP receptor protein